MASEWSVGWGGCLWPRIHYFFTTHLSTFLVCQASGRMNNENETVHVQISNVHAQRVEQGEAAWNIYSGFRYFSSLLTLWLIHLAEQNCVTSIETNPRISIPQQILFVS